jgi:ubiquinone/menaquinone biosynthesis C-methylase UbiE
MLNLLSSDLGKYINPYSNIAQYENNIPTCKIQNWSKGMQANAYFFGHPEYSEKYLKTENCSKSFGERWKAAIGSWDNKIVIDVGCGPGNLYVAVGGTPQVLIGIDISYGALEKAMQLGYSPILADAQDLPLIDNCADIVTLNAVLHHCDDMVKVLTEAARLVRPGGILITDEDPQCTAWNHKGLGILVNEARKKFPMYWLPGRSSQYRTKKERALRLATEIHNRKPGDGVTPELYYNTLEPLGFTLKLFPHNHAVGAELFRGNCGRSLLKYNLAQRLSGMDLNSPEAAESIMCIARKFETEAC